MFHFEIGNEIETHRFIISQANREVMSVDLFGHAERVLVLDYVAFARALNHAFHQLKGTATLLRADGEALLTLSFVGGIVHVRVQRDASIHAFQTDQSYVTPMLSKIGIVE